METIREVLNHIKDQTGMTLMEDDYFAGVRCKGSVRYFNVDEVTPMQLAKLILISGPDKVIKCVQPNGVSRQAIFF